MSQTTHVAKEQAAGVGQSAAGAGQHVAGVAKEEAGNVAQEAVSQARDVVGTAREQLVQQAAEQQDRLAGGLRTLGRELGSMADSNEDPGYASDLARQASSTINDVAGWLENRDPNGLMDDVRSFARRRPGAFLALAVGAGVLAGRLTRGLKDEASSGPSGSTTRSPYAGSSSGYTGGGLPETTTTGTGAYGATTGVPAYGTETVTGTTTGHTAAGPYDTPGTSTTPATTVEEDVVIVSPPVGENTGQEGRP
jgi:hypothetical protein